MLILMFACWTSAQDPRGSMTGQVTDRSGASIPGATVRLTQEATGVVIGATSNETGAFEAPYLLTGTYKISASASGFKTWERGGVELRIGDRLRIDITLEVGEITERVEVTSTAPVIESTTASVGQVIDAKQFANLPLRSGNVSWVYSMAPGAVLTALPYDGPWNIEQGSNIAIAGSKKGQGGVDFNVDGVSNNSYGGNTAFVPPADMVQEVKINTTSYDASIGHSAGSSVDISLKSGNNGLHGTLGYSLATGPMMTRNWFTNKFIFDPTTGPVTDDKIKANTPNTKWQRYSAAVGGPVMIPKIYDGRNRTFWMFGWQTHNRRRPLASLNSVPTAEMARGDFSALLSLGARYQIYDPFTTVPAAGGRFQRSPLAGNRIPEARIDAGAKAFLKYFPAPNTAGTADFLNNYQRTRQEKQDLNQPIARIDHVFSDRNRMYGRYTHSDFNGSFDELIPGSDARGRLRQRPHRGIALDDVAVLSPSMVLDIRYGFTWFREYESFKNIGWNIGEFGFPQSLINQLDPAGISFPQLSITNMLQLGNNGGFQRTNYSHSLLGVLNWSRGSHNLKMGFDGRLMLENNKTYGNVSPLINVDATYTRGPLDNTPASPAGQPLASFLFGIPTGGGVDVNDSRAERSPYYAMFLQDDWRITRKLTLNLGLRWEYEGPITERYDRSSGDFDFATTNPIQAQAQAAYAVNPIPEIAPANFKTAGGLTFLGQNGLPRTIRPADFRTFMPRLGFAYQLNQKTVLRGGYGIFYGLLGADFSDVAQPNFNRRTNIVPTNNNGQTYIASISNPLPLGLDQPAGNKDGLRTFLGRGPGFFAADGRRPYTQRWSFTGQYEPFSRSVIEVGYIGSRGTRLRFDNNFNPIPRQYLSASPERDQATVDYLTARTVNPFRGIQGFEGTAQFTGANSSRAQLLRPLPHFGDLNTGLPGGSSWYHAATVRFERRFQKGVQFQVNYTWSRAMEALGYLNDTDSAPEHVVSDIDRPHRITFSGIWELPFGRQWHPLVRGVAGGWSLNAIWQRQSGAPLAFGNVILRGTFDQLPLSGSSRSVERWFNTAPFERDQNKQLANNIRALSSRLSGVRADGIDVWDLSVHKNFKVREKLTLQLRGEAEGATNHPNFAAPNLSPTSTLFGAVNATQTGQEERRIFAGLKLLF